MYSCHRVKLFENQSNHSLINVGFIRLVTWPGVERLSRKGYEGSKLFMFFFFFLYFDTKIISQMW